MTFKVIESEESTMARSGQTERDRHMVCIHGQVFGKCMLRIERTNQIWPTMTLKVNVKVSFKDAKSAYASINAGSSCFFILARTGEWWTGR